MTFWQIEMTSMDPGSGQRANQRYPKKAQEVNHINDN